MVLFLLMIMRFAHSHRSRRSLRRCCTTHFYRTHPSSLLMHSLKANRRPLPRNLWTAVLVYPSVAGQPHESVLERPESPPLHSRHLLRVLLDNRMNLCWSDQNHLLSIHVIYRNRVRVRRFEDNLLSVLKDVRVRSIVGRCILSYRARRRWHYLWHFYYPRANNASGV